MRPLLISYSYAFRNGGDALVCRYSSEQSEAVHGVLTMFPRLKLLLQCAKILLLSSTL